MRFSDAELENLSAEVRRVVQRTWETYGFSDKMQIQRHLRQHIPVLIKCIQDERKVSQELADLLVKYSSHEDASCTKVCNSCKNPLDQHDISCEIRIALEKV